MSLLKKFDPKIYGAIQNETKRQSQNLELIASENFVSEAVLEAQGSVLTNKYAEGYPGKRYYGGCEFVDEVEKLARVRAKKLFNADGANVQPHSGSQANMGVYFACLEPGDTVLSMNLDHGGHLSHGSPVNFSGRIYNVVFYGVNKETEQIDYEEVKNIAKEHRPKLIVVGASAYPRVIDFKAFREIADEVGARIVVDIAHIAGLVATGLHPSPIPFAEYVTSTTHKTLRGPRGGLILFQKKYGKKINSRVFPGMQGGPLMHVIAAKAVAFKEAMTDEFTDYQNQIVKNAKTLSTRLMDNGLTLVSGGTDNHLMMINVKEKVNLTGKIAEEALELAGITANKNMIPYDTESPFVTSGVRIGTPAITTRGLKEPEMIVLADLITEVLNNPESESVRDNTKKKVMEICETFPLYANRIDG